jgi:tRNA (guanine-N7-)-methyltransferase
MHANSRPVFSAQASIHRRLARTVQRHADSPFLRPIAAFNREAFEASLAAWRADGGKPLILDAGCGVGLSTRHLAAAFPDHFVIGVDRSSDRVERQTRWPSAACANWVCVRADLVDYWRLMLGAGVHPERHYLLYPNPWPKQDHLGRRWHGHPVFPTLVALGGYFECRSNWRIYIEECAAALGQLTGMTVASEPYLAAADSGVHGQGSITPFERKYSLSGHALWRCRATLARGSAHQLTAARGQAILPILK